MKGSGSVRSEAIAKKTVVAWRLGWGRVYILHRGLTEGLSLTSYDK